MLKTKITADEFDALDESIASHYQKQGDGYVLDTDGARSLKRSVKAERARSESALRQLSRVVPGISREENGRTVYLPMEDWEEATDEVVEKHDDLDMDDDELATFRKWKESGGEDADDAEMRQQLADARRENRDLLKSNKTLTKKAARAEESAGTVGKENRDLIRERDINAALDSAGVSDPRKRRLAGLVLKDRGLKVVDGATHVRGEDGDLIPLDEYAPDWAASDEGKDFVSASLNRDDDGHRPPPRLNKKEQKLPAKARLARLYSR